jgi:hypothetical protein
VERNTEARSYKNFCSGKAISITDSECVFVALGIQCVMRMRHVVICVIYGPSVFFHIVKTNADFREKKLLNVKCLC